MGRLALAWIAAGCAWAQLDNLRPEATLLAEVKEKMLDLLASQPNYTCLETVERTRQAPGGGWQLDDTLRLEVALVNGKEMFAWPGAKQFEDRDIRDLVSTGMFGNGNYGIYTRMLFSAGGPPFLFRGEASLDGLRTFRYDFRVSRERSGYHLRNGDRGAITGFHGSVYLEPEQAELRRLEVYADDIPAELGLTAAEDRVDYARVRIGEEDFLLPLESNLRMDGDDSMSRNRVRFSGCRKFAGESSLIFDDPEVQTLAESQMVTEVELPPDVTLTLEIESDLKPDRGAVGDEVVAKLRSDIKRGKLVVVRKGAVARGRVITLDRVKGEYYLAIVFRDLEWKGGHASVRARFDGTGGLTFAGRSRMQITTDGAIQLQGGRTLRGEILLYRTER